MINQRMKLKKRIAFDIGDRIILIITIICIITYILLNRFTIKSKEILEDIANNKSMELSTIIINKSLSEIIINNDLQSIINITRNETGEITSINYEKYK